MHKSMSMKRELTIDGVEVSHCDQIGWYETVGGDVTPLPKKRKTPKDAKITAVYTKTNSTNADS